MRKNVGNKIYVLPVRVRITRIGVAICLLILFALSLHYLDLDIARFMSRISNFPRIARLFMQFNTSMLLPGFGQFVVSFLMGFVGLVLGGVVAVPLAFLAAENIAPYRPLAVCIKAYVSIVRAVPSLVIILMVVAAVGLGHTTGVVGLTISSMGYLTKAFIATIEEQDQSIILSMRTTGASWFQVVIHGLLPAVITGFLAWGAMRLEMSVAESISLGVVGAGGIGALLSRAIRGFDYASISVIICIIFVCMFLLEAAVKQVKRKLV